MKIEIFYNAGTADVMTLESPVGLTNAETLARQISNCDLIHTVRLRNGDEYTDFQKGAKK